MKYIFVCIVLVSSLYSDMIKYKTLACPSIELLKGAKQVEMEDSLKLEMYAISHSCVVLSKEDSIEVIGYDPVNSEDIFQQILYKKTGTQLYMLHDAVHIEQAGKKNIYRF
ncbi:MAG: hypothetical protein Q9M34_07370 [Sulfurimonas sp.]|nr:hypothetical protein [Sulfurimonas sp.]